MNDTTPLLAIVGDDARIEPLARELSLDGYAVRTAATCSALRSLAQARLLDLVLFAPVGCARDGEDVRALRRGRLGPQVEPSTRVLWLCAGADPAELLDAFRAGSDDVLRAPWSLPELQARVRALLARGRSREPRVLHHCELCIDTASREVHFGSSRVELRRQEYTLLVHLARDPHRVFSGHELLSDMWGFHAEGSTRTLALHASRLRRKLALVGAGAEWVATVWGVGYRLQTPSEQSVAELEGTAGRAA